MTDENRTFLLYPDDGDDLTERDEASGLTIPKRAVRGNPLRRTSLRAGTRAGAGRKSKGLHRRTGGRGGRSCSRQRKALKAPDTGRGIGTAGGCRKNRGRLPICCQ